MNNGVGEEIQDQGSGGSGTEPENSDGPGRQNQGEGGEHVEVGGGEEIEEEGDTVDVARRVEEEETRARELVVETAKVRFSSGVGFGGTVLSLSYDRRERDGAREGGTEGGQRHTETERGRERGRGRERNFNGGRKLFFLLPPRERERVAEGRAGGGERERGREGRTGGGGETKTQREAGTEGEGERERGRD